MAALTGSVKAASVVKDLATGTNHLQIIIDVDIAGNTINTAGQVPDHATPRTPVNLIGRAVTVNTNGSNELVTSTGIVIT